MKAYIKKWRKQLKQPLFMIGGSISYVTARIIICYSYFINSRRIVCGYFFVENAHLSVYLLHTLKCMFIVRMTSP